VGVVPVIIAVLATLFVTVLAVDVHALRRRRVDAGPAEEIDGTDWGVLHLPPGARPGAG
jgi:hypothetical protein